MKNFFWTMLVTFGFFQAYPHPHSMKTLEDQLNNSQECKTSLVVLERLLPENAVETGEFIGKGFDDEPFGLSVGLKGEERRRCILEMCISAANQEKSLSSHLSTIVRCGPRIIGALVCTLPNPPDSGKDQVNVSPNVKRLFDVMQWADQQAHNSLLELGLNPNVPEAALGFVDSEFRGRILPGEKTIFMALVAIAEDNAASLGWTGLYCHANDISGKQLLRAGWKCVYSIGYKEIPKKWLIDPKPGNLHVCYKETSGKVRSHD